MSEHTRIVSEIWDELQALCAEDPRHTELHVLVHQGGLIVGDSDALAEFERAPAPERRATLLAVSRLIPPQSGLAEQAFRLIAERDVLDVDDLRLAVWAGLSPREAGWDVLTSDTREEHLEALVRAGVPGCAADLLALAEEQLEPIDKAALVLAWCKYRPFERSAEEYRLIDEIGGEPRFEAIGRVLARTPISEFVARTWILDTCVQWQAAAGEPDRACADAQMGALQAAGGAPAEGAVRVREALELTTRLSDPLRAGQVYAVYSAQVRASASNRGSALSRR